MNVELAHAKINLALVVGPRRDDGFHEIATVLQPIELADTVTVERAEQGVSVDGFPEDTLARRALDLLGGSWAVRIEKRVPVAAGLGGGSSDAAAALRLANKLLPEPRSREELHRIAAEVGTDVPFFLGPGPKLARGRGTELAPLDLPQDYAVVLVLPEGAVKESSAAVYAAFQVHGGFEDRVRTLEAALEDKDLEALPPNDLASSPVAGDLRELGAFRADVSGAGPVVYGLFREAAAAAIAASRLENGAAVWVTKPAW